MMRHRGSIGVLLVLGAASCGEPPPEPALPPRAVATVKQVVRDPARRLRLAGTAAAWKEETLSFQVGGRVTWVIEPESSVLGPSVDEEFRPRRDGDVVARVDPERYENALQAAQASLAGIQAQLRATEQQLEDVLPQELAKAEAERNRARDNRDRIQRAMARNAVAGTELTNAEAAFATATAVVESVRGQIKAKGSERDALAAQVSLAEQSVKTAEFDLRDTELRAPFSGRITQVALVPGALVQPGTPVAELAMMDPIKIELTVSSETDRAIGDQNRALVFLRDSSDPIVASVYQRDSVADAATRTVGISLICRNPEVTERPAGATVIPDAIPLIQFPADDRRAWFIERSAVRRDAEGTFAWRLKDFSKAMTTGRPVAVERMPIELGEARRDFVGLYQFHEFLPPPDLMPVLEAAPGITVDTMFFAMGVPEDFQGGNVVLVRRSWKFRPGDVVEVQLDLAASGPGIYVPASAIVHDGPQAYVFVVAGDGEESALQRVDVTLSGTVGDEVRIADEVLAGGRPIVTSGTHVLRDGERVQIGSTQALR